MSTNLATRLLGGLRIWQKIALIGIVFTFPLALTMYYLLDEKNYKIDFARWELYGDEYLRPTSELLRSALEHKTATGQNLAGDAAAKLEAAKLQAQILSQLKDLEAVDARLGAPLHTAPREMKDRSRGSATPAAIRESWDHTSRLGDPAVADEAHARLVGDIRTLITHVGDSSKLILDPDLDTYYLMDALLLKEPDVMDRASQMGDEVAQV